MSYIEDITPTLILPPQGGGDVEVEIASLTALVMTHFKGGGDVEVEK